jgi:hypothetical protein
MKTSGNGSRQTKSDRAQKMDIVSKPRPSHISNPQNHRAGYPERPGKFEKIANDFPRKPTEIPC